MCKPWPAQHLPIMGFMSLFLQPQYGNSMDPRPGKASDMLVLSRKAGETIRIGSSIDLVVLGVSHGRVKLGFAGPKQIPVRRGELVDAAARQETPRTSVTEEYDCRELVSATHS